MDLDVNMIQGYFVAPPLPKEVAESLLERTAGHPNHLAKILADRMQGSESPARTLPSADDSRSGPDCDSCGSCYNLL